MKSWKNHPKKLLRIGPDPFFPRSSPGISPQPKIDFLYYEISGPDICSLICASRYDEFLIVCGRVFYFYWFTPQPRYTSSPARLSRPPGSLKPSSSRFFLSCCCTILQQYTKIPSSYKYKDHPMLLSWKLHCICIVTGQSINKWFQFQRTIARLYNGTEEGN